MWACDSCAPIENVGSRKLRTLQGQAKGQPQRVIHDDSAPSSVMATLPPSCCRRAATSMRAAFCRSRSAMASGLAGYRSRTAAGEISRSGGGRIIDPKGRPRWPWEEVVEWRDARRPKLSCVKTALQRALCSVTHL